MSNAGEKARGNASRRCGINAGEEIAEGEDGVDGFGCGWIRRLTEAMAALAS